MANEVIPLPRLVPFSVPITPTLLPEETRLSISLFLPDSLSLNLSSASYVVR